MEEHSIPLGFDMEDADRVDLFLSAWEFEARPGLDPAVEVFWKRIDDSGIRVELVGVEVPAALRRRGMGGAAMDAATAMADRFGVTIVLHPEPSRMDALELWYERFGFFRSQEGQLEYEPREPVPASPPDGSAPHR